MRTLDDLPLTGSRVLLRVDLNVPMQDGQVSDGTRIERAVPTLAELSDKGARVIVLSHFGRPKGQVVPDMSLASLTGPLDAALERPVAFSDMQGAAAAVAAVYTRNSITCITSRWLQVTPSPQRLNPGKAGRRKVDVAAS